MCKTSYSNITASYFSEYFFCFLHNFAGIFNVSRVLLYRHLLPYNFLCDFAVQVAFLLFCFDLLLILLLTADICGIITR